MFDPNEMHDPPPPRIQELRLQHLRTLLLAGIPCILWAEDALLFAHGVPTGLFDQQVLVPDHLLVSAVYTLQKNKYNPSPINPWFVEENGPLKGTPAWPKGIYLKHDAIPMDHPYKLHPWPRGIYLLPTSYYGLDVDDGHRFQSLVPPLANENADILVPKYHAMLEALVYAMLHPPGGFGSGGIIPTKQHQQYMSYMLMYRIKYDPDDPDDVIAAKKEAYQKEIFDELQTEDARWYFGRTFSKDPFTRQDIVDYLRGKGHPTPSTSLATPLNSKSKLSIPSAHLTIAHGSRPYSTYPAMNKTIADHSPNTWRRHSPRQFSAERFLLRHFVNLLKRR